MLNDDFEKLNKKNAELRKIDESSKIISYLLFPIKTTYNYDIFIVEKQGKKRENYRT
jgi:hypothetical protein